MPWTLQLYVFKQMGKTFLLTAAGLTAVLSMGGGVFNMIKIDTITAGELFRLMLLVIPVAGTLTLPITTIYSAAATYGRLAADNEFIACRSSGVNILTMMLPTLFLSLVSAVITFLSLNFLIPVMIGNLDRIVGMDLESIVRQRINKPGRKVPGMERFRLYADEASVAPVGDASELRLTGVAFLEMDGDDVARIGTARQVAIQIERRGRQTLISGLMRDLTFYDRRTERFIEGQIQRIPPNVVPYRVPVKIKFLDLFRLLHYRNQPDAWVDVRDRIDRFRVAVGRAWVYEHLAQSLRQVGAVTVSAPDRTYGLVLASGSNLPIDDRIRQERDGSLTIEDVTVEERQAGQARRIPAGRATIEVTHATQYDQCRILIELFENVRVPDFGQPPDGAPPQDRVRLTPVPVPGEIAAKLESLTDRQLLSSTLDAARDPRIRARQGQVVEHIAATVRKITGVLHQRLAFTISVFVLGLLAAGLGIVFSQSQLLVSVGISMLPGLVVLVTILMGKQLAEKPGTVTLGLGVIWGGLVLVAALDAWLLLVKVRR